MRFTVNLKSKKLWFIGSAIAVLLPLSVALAFAVLPSFRNKSDRSKTPPKITLKQVSAPHQPTKSTPQPASQAVTEQSSLVSESSETGAKNLAIQKKKNPQIANNCSTCNGSGNITCPACNGQGSINCLTCGGDGKIACGACGATGQLTCSICKGDGKTACAQCSGSGRYGLCSTCEGKGKVWCNT